MDPTRMLLIKTVKKLCRAKIVCHVLNLLCTLLLLADIVLFLIYDTNVNLSIIIIIIAILTIAIFLQVISVIMLAQLNYYEEVKIFLQELLFNKKLND